MEENKKVETQDAETETVETETVETEIVETEGLNEADAAEEEQKDEEKKKASGGMTSTRNGLCLRALIGGMILYYAYTIAADITSTPADQRTMLYVFVAIFCVAGIWIIADSLKRIFKKEYDK
ncbi:MAG: hypothetical protein ACI4AA_06445 [Lachnospiraceae bacterium]